MEPTIEPTAKPTTAEPAVAAERAKAAEAAEPAEHRTAPATAQMRAAALWAGSVRPWITARWGGLRGPERFVVVGAGLATIGALVVTGTANRNANGATGTAVVILALAVAGIGFVPIVRRRPNAAGVLVGWSAALAALAVMDMIHPIRYSGDLDVFGGAIGAVGLGVTVVGAGMLLAGVVVLRRGLGLPPETATPRLTPIRVLLGGGASLLVLSWLVLLALADGFAMRAIDAIAVVSACLALPVADLSPRLAVPARWSHLAETAPAGALAGLAALIILDGALVVVGRLGELGDSDIASVIGFALYLLAGFTFVGAAIASFIGFIRPKPAIPADVPGNA